MRGVYTALITPFNQDLEIDWDTYRQIIKDQCDASVAGVIPCGTTGESPTLSLTEKKKLIETAIEVTRGTKTVVVAGTGSSSTRDTVELSRWASDQGVAGVLVVTPYYNKPSQAGLLNHFRAVADAVSCEVMLYNVPGRTGVSLTAETITELAEHPRIRSIKEATGNITFATEIRAQLRAKGRSLDILSGDDPTYLALLSVGACGVVSVASNLFPRGMVSLQRAFDSSKPDEALALHERFYPLFRDLFIESNPGPIKEAMAWAGLGNAYTRPPLARLSAANREKLLHSIAACDLKSGQGGLR